MGEPAPHIAEYRRVLIDFAHRLQDDPGLDVPLAALTEIANRNAMHPWEIASENVNCCNVLWHLVRGWFLADAVLERVAATLGVAEREYVPADTERRDE